MLRKQINGRQQEKPLEMPSGFFFKGIFEFIFRNEFNGDKLYSQYKIYSQLQRYIKRNAIFDKIAN